MYFNLFIGKSWYTITIWVLSCFCLYCMNKILQICEIYVSQCNIAAFGARKVHGFSFFLKAVPQYERTLGMSVLKLKQLGHNM